jgi:hypothetical protein
MSEGSVALPLALFPPVHWWLHALEEGTYVDVDRPFQKQTLRNRFTVLTCNGPQSLSIPVRSTGGQTTALRSIQMADGKWRQEHLHTLRSAYGRAAYFEHFYPVVEQIYSHPTTSLHEFAMASLDLIQNPLRKKNQTLYFQPNAESQVDEAQSRALSAALEPSYPGIQEPGYPQVFSDRFAFVHNLSYLDLLMNKGPEAIDYILFIKNGSRPVEMGPK